MREASVAGHRDPLLSDAMGALQDPMGPGLSRETQRTRVASDARRTQREARRITSSRLSRASLLWLPTKIRWIRP